MSNFRFIDTVGGATLTLNVFQANFAGTHEVSVPLIASTVMTDYRVGNVFFHNTVNATNLDLGNGTVRLYGDVTVSSSAMFRSNGSVTVYLQPEGAGPTPTLSTPVLNVTGASTQANMAGFVVSPAINIYGSGKYDAQINGALGNKSTNVAVTDDGYLKLTAAQTNLAHISVGNYGALGGDITGAVFNSADPNYNVTLNANAILAPFTGSTGPTRTELGGATIFLGIQNASTGTTYEVGDKAGDETSIYKGFALGAYTTSANITKELKSIGGDLNGYISYAGINNGATAIYRGDGTSTTANIKFSKTGYLNLAADFNKDAITANDVYKAANPGWGVDANLPYPKLIKTFNLTRDPGNEKGTLLSFSVDNGAKIQLGQTVHVENGTIGTWNNNSNFTGGNLKGVLELKNGMFWAPSDDFTAADTGILRFSGRTVFSPNDFVNVNCLEALGSRFEYSGLPMFNLGSGTGNLTFTIDWRTAGAGGTMPYTAEFMRNCDYIRSNYLDTTFLSNLEIGHGKFLISVWDRTNTNIFKTTNGSKIVYGGSGGGATPWIGFAAMLSNLTVNMEVNAGSASIQCGTDDPDRIIHALGTGYGGTDAFTAAIPDQTVVFQQPVTAAGIRILSGSATFTGNVVTTGNIEAQAGNVAFNGGLNLSGGNRTLTSSGPGVVTLVGALSSTAGGNTLKITGSGPVTIGSVLTGANSPTLEVDGTGTYLFNGTSTMTGGIKLTSGTAIAATASGLGAPSNTVTFNGGTLQYAIANTTDYSGRFVTTGSQPIRIDTNSQNVSFATALAGAGTSLTKLGYGKLTLTAAPTYTGGTTVSNGTLLLSGANNMPATGTLAVSAAGTFSLADGTARTTTTAASLNLAGGSTLAFDWKAAALDKLTSTAAATTTGNIGIVIANSAPTGSGVLISSPLGGLSPAGATKYFLANNTNYKAALTVSDTDVSIGTYTTGTALTNAYWKGGQVAGAEGTMAFSDGAVSNWATDLAGTGTALVPGSTSVNAFFSTTNASQQGSLALGADMSFGTMTFDDANAVTIAGGNAITLSGTGTGVSSAISVSPTSNATTTINSGVILGASQTWTVANGKTLAVGGAIGATAAANTLTKAGNGTLILSGANSYMGATIVGNTPIVGVPQGGTLLLDANAGGSLNSVSPLTLTGGNFEVKGKASGATAQFLGNLTLTAGTANKIVLNPNDGDGTTLILGSTWSRGVGASLLIDYSSANAGTRQVQTAAPTVTYALSNGVYGGILVKDSDGVTGFATRDASFYIVRYDDTTGTTLVGNSNSGTINHTTRDIAYLGGNGGTFSWTGVASRSVNSLTIDTTTNYGTIDIGPATNILGLTSLGILFKGGNPGTLTGGQVGANGSEVIVHQTGTGSGTMTINSRISSGSGSLTKDGDGLLVVGGANVYTGATTVNGGTLRAGVASVANTSGAFGLNSPVTLANVAGTTLDANSLDNTIGALAGGGAIGGNVTLGTAALTVGGNNGTGVYAGVISSTGTPTTSLIKVGTGTQTLTAANTYVGATILNKGTLILAGTAGSLPNTNAVTVTGAGTLKVGDDITNANNNGMDNRINPAATLTLGGGDVSNAWGGTLTLYKPATGAASQSFKSLTNAAGYSTIQNAGGGTTATLTFTDPNNTVYSRSAGGIVNFAPAVTTFTNAPITNISAGTVGEAGAGLDTILIGALLNNADFVKPADGAVTAVTAYNTKDNPAQWGTLAGNDGIITSAAISGTTASGAVSINALRSTGAGTLAIGTGDANSLSIKSGMILSTNTLTIDGPGKLTSGNGQDLVIYNTDTVTVNAPITGSIGLTKAGAGILSLTSTANTFNGTIYDHAGTLDFNPDGNATYANAISGGGSITKNGANTLSLTGPVSIGGSFTVNADGGTAILSGTAQTGAFTVSGGTATISGGLKTTGNISIGNGTLNVSGEVNHAGGSPSILIGNVAGGTATLNMSGSANIFFTSGPSPHIDMATGAGSTAYLNISGGTASAQYCNWGTGGAAIVTQSDGTFSATGNWTLGNGGAGTSTYTMTGGVANLTAAAISGGTGSDGTMTVSGGVMNFPTTLALGNGTLAGKVGTLNIEGTGLVKAVGTLTIGGNAVQSGVVNLKGGTLAASALITKGNGAAAFNFTGGTLQAANNAFILGSALGAITQNATDNNSLFDVTASNAAVQSHYSAVGSGTNTATVNVYAGKTLTMSANKILSIGNKGVLKGNGTVITSGTGGVAVTSGGTVSPGASVGKIAVTGNLLIETGGIYEWQLADKGLSPGTGWDQITATNNITFGGKLIFSIDDSLLAGSIDGTESFTVATATGTMGAPASYSFLGDWTGTLEVVGKDLVLKSLVPAVGLPDTDNNGVVDAADFINLKKNFNKFASGATTAEGDFNGSGTVDWSDLSNLMARMGTGGPAPATTPEPATLGLLAIGALAVVRRRRS